MSSKCFPIIAIALLGLLAIPVLAFQESPTYAEEYDLYQKAAQETDMAKRKAIVLDFVQKFDESQLDPNVAYLYSQYLDVFRKSANWSQMASAAEDFLKFRPSNEAIAAAATEAYQRMGEPEKLVSFGTRLYNDSPSASTAYLVAKAYKSMNDRVNFQKWAERTLRHAPRNAEMLLELANSAWMSRDIATAAKYASRAIEALEAQGENPAANPSLAFAYRAVGENAYIQGEFTEARKNFERAAELDPMVDFTHLRLGYCYWRSNRVDQAIRSFAKAVALGGSSSKEARQQLYDLLKQRFGSTSTASQVINEAKKELGVS